MRGLVTTLVTLSVTVVFLICITVTSWVIYYKCSVCTKEIGESTAYIVAITSSGVTLFFCGVTTGLLSVYKEFEVNKEYVTW